MQKLTDILGRKCQVPGAKCQGILHGRFNNVLRAIGCIVVTSIMLLSLTGCINENEITADPTPEPVEQIKADFYLQLRVQQNSNTNTRSITDTEGGSSSSTFPGQANENSLNSATLFFYNVASEEDQSQNELVCTFPATKIDTRSDEISYDVIAKLEKEHLVGMAGNKLHLYVLANMNTDYSFRPATEAALLAEKFTEASAGLYTQPFGNHENGKACPMSNQTYYEIDLTNVKLAEGDEDDTSHNKLLAIFKKLFTEDYEDGDDKGILWKASSVEIKDDEGELLYKGNGELYLERMVARIDFQPSANATQLVGAKDNNNKDVYLKVVSLELFNLDKQAYLFRHTAAGGNAEAVKPFGNENGTVTNVYNWIADSDWGNKISANHKYFNQMADSPGNDANDNNVTLWNFTDEIGTHTTVEQINTNPKVDSYHPWYYVMENTVNTTDKMNLQYSTGIEFRMVVCNADGTPVDQLSGDTPYRITMQTGAADDKDNWYKEPAWVAAKAATGEDTNTAEPGGYYLTYRYLIDHNNEAVSTNNSSSVNPDTGAATAKAPMQYAIVRNNIYRISVSGITRLPDPHEPDNPWMSVEIKVLPWVKRTIEVNW